MSTTYTCANGHDSSDLDYCSVCGTRIDGAGAPAPTTADVPVTGAAGGGGAPAVCPHCDTDLDPSSRFCEVCGYDPSTGSLPQAPVVQPAGPAATADAVPDDSGAASPTGSGTWVVVIAADRAYYDRNQVTEVQFPLGLPSRTIELRPGTAYTIGRRSRTRGTFPAVDLAGPPEDAAVSHTHAGLLSKDDSSWELVDHGSTNGTYVNEAPTPITPNTPVPLVAGDRIYVGAWTQITLTHHP